MSFEPAAAIRRAESADVPAAAAVMLHAFHGYENARLGTGYARAFLASFLSAETRSLLIAEDRTGILGFASAEDSELRAQRYRELRLAAASAFLSRPWLALDADVFRMARRRISMDGREPLPPSWFLSLIGVHPDAQGRGVGRSLLHAFQEEGRNRGYDRATLFVRADNFGALALYESGGWQQRSAPVAGRATLEFRFAHEQALPAAQAR